MAWLTDNSLKCDTCENVLQAYGSTVEQMLDTAIVARWGMWTGKTVGGEPFLTVSCRNCREGSHRRIVKRIEDRVVHQTNLWGDTND